MTEVYVIRNQLGHYWGKSKAWVDGTEPRAVMRTPHRDEATNTLVELSARDIDLRGEVVAAALSERGEPEVEASDIPVPLTPEQIAAEEAARLARASLVTLPRSITPSPLPFFLSSSQTSSFSFSSFY